ncbi:MAG: hypothetical protein ACP6IQ_01885 [Candidatus Njordarchaeia archaeon]
MRIVTNNQYRPILGFHDLTEKEKEEMIEHFCNDEEYAIDSSYFRYRKTIYPLSEFVRVEDNNLKKEWDGVLSINAFKGVLIKVSNAMEAVKVATLYC